MRTHAAFDSTSSVMHTWRHTTLADGLIRLSVRQGDLINETSEVIVNPANTKMLHRSALALHLNEMSGDMIQSGSDANITKYGSIPVGDCVATDAGSLPFKKIVHAVGPVWSYDADEQKIAKQQLMSAIFNSLVCTSAFGYSSIAFPTIYNNVSIEVPRDVAAKCFFRAVQRYATREQSKMSNEVKVQPVTDIRFTNVDDETVAHFVNEFDQRSL